MISNYAELVAAIKVWLKRGSSMDSAIPYFIGLTEARLNRDFLSNQRIVELETTDNPIPFPADYWTPKNLVFSSNGIEYSLRQVGIEEFSRHAGYEDGVFCEQEGELKISGVSASGFKLRYFAKIPALTESNTTNWLLSRHPDLYLWGALQEAAPQMGADARAILWSTKFENALSDAIKDNDRYVFGGSSLRISAS